MCLAIPGEVLQVVEDELRSARVDFGGVVKHVCLAYVPEAGPGDFVIVHAGFAIARVDAAAAAETLAYLAEMESEDGSPSVADATARPGSATGTRRRDPR